MPAEYNRIFAAGKRFSGACVTLVAAFQERNETGSFVKSVKLSQRPRLGLAIAKKQIKRAHERNRVKRLLRECFRANTPCLAGLEFIAMAKSAAQKTPNPALKLEIERLFSKAVGFFAAAPTTEAGVHVSAITPQHHSPIKQ